MAAITSAQTGLWSATSTWVGGVVPGEFDTVTIAAGHTVTLDGTRIVGNDTTNGLTINGRLRASRTVNSLLTLKCTVANATTGEWDWGVQGDTIPVGVTAGIRVNYSGTMANNKYELRLGTTNRMNLIAMRGVDKVRHTKTTTAVTGGSTTTFTVTDATGWAVGDYIIVSADQNSTSSQVEGQAITAISGNNVTVGTAWTNSRAAGAVVVNVWSNVYVEHFNSANWGVFSITPRTGMPANSVDIKNVSFHGMSDGLDGGAFALRSAPYFANSTAVFRDGVIARCAATNIRRDGTNQTAIGGGGIGFGTLQSTVQFDFLECVVAQRGAPLSSAAALRTTSLSSGVGFRQCCIVNCSRGYLSNYSEGGLGIVITDLTFRNGSSAVVVSPGTACVVNGGDLDRCIRFTEVLSGDITVSNANFGTNNSGFVTNSVAALGLVRCTINNSTVGSMALASSLFTTTPANPLAEFSFVNKNSDVTVQEIQTSAGFISRDNAVSLRGTSAIKFQPQVASLPLSRTYLLAGASAGQTYLVRGSLLFDTAYGTATPPSVTLSGQGSTPAVFTAPATANAWHDFALTVTPSSTGDLTLTVTGTSAATTGSFWLDGVILPPFVVTARHYGYLYNNAIFQTVDPVITQPNASIVAAYTGIAINHTTDTITLTANRTVAEIYDYAQWDISQTANLTVAQYLSGDLTNLTSAYNIVIDGATISGSSSNVILAPGFSASLLNGGSSTARFFGAVSLNSPGAVSQSFGTATLTFTAAGTYNLSGASITGTVTLVNTSGSPVTVRLNPGVTFVNTGPNITVDNAARVALTVNNVISGSRIQIYNSTTSTEIVNQIVSGTSFVYNYVDGTGITAGNLIRVRLAEFTGATASLTFETLATALISDWSVRGDQVNDSVYQTNGINGSTVTEFVFDYPNVQVDINDPDGTTTISRLYAWYCYERTSVDGIRLLGDGLLAEDTANYKVITSVIDLRLDNTSANGVVFTGDQRLYRDDGAVPVVSSTTGGGSITLYAGKVYVVATGGSALTPSESAKLMSLPTNALTTPNFLALK